MIEVKLNQAMTDSHENKRRIFIITNEKGEYYSGISPFWTKDLNKCVSVIRVFSEQVHTARGLLEELERCKERPKSEYNVDLYSFNSLFLQEVDVTIKND